jgi:putative sigma-54 modulation protein
MNLIISGHHLAITPSIRSYIEDKLSRIRRHFDHVIDVSVILTVDHLARQVEVSCHIAGKDIVAKSDDPDLYAAIDAVADKLDRQIIKYKDRLHAHPHDALKHRSPSD